MVEGEFVELAKDTSQVYGIVEVDGQSEPVARPREPVRSRLRSSDIGLTPGYDHFMEQEIAAQEATVRGVVDMLRRTLPSRGRPGGAAVCVYHRGEKVVDVWAGTRNQAGDPWEEDTVSISFSTTKGVASTLLHLYADRGLIEYDAPVCEYWPGFADGGKQDTTVRQLLCHEAGLYAMTDIVEHADQT